MKVFTISYKGETRDYRDSFDEATSTVLFALKDRMACMMLTGASEAKATDFSIEEKEVEFGTPEFSMSYKKVSNSLYLEYGEVEVEDKENVIDYYDGEPYISDIVTVGSHMEKHMYIHIADVKRALTVEWSKTLIVVDDFDEWLTMTSEDIFASLYEE